MHSRSNTSQTTRTAAQTKNILPRSHSDKNPSPLLKKQKLLTTHIRPMRDPIPSHARLVSPLRPHLSIMRLLLYGGKSSFVK